jgi:potassium-dependent mechanosensitive channel
LPQFSVRPNANNASLKWPNDKKPGNIDVRTTRPLSKLILAIAALLAFSAPAFAQEKSVAADAKPAIAPAAGAKAGPAAAPAEQPVQQPPPAPAPEKAEAPPPPPASLPPEVNDTISKVVGTMEGAEKSLAEISGVNSDLARLRDDIDEVIAKSTRTADSLRPRLADIQNQINQLGPAPEKDQPPEAPSAAAERTRLSTEASELGGAIKTLEVMWWRARQAIEKITELRLQLFVRSLTERMSSPLFADLWKNVARDWPGVSWRLQYNFKDVGNAIDREKGGLVLLLSVAAIVYLLLKALVLRATRYRGAPGEPLPTFFQRAASAAWIAPARAIPGVVTALGLYAGLDYLNLLFYPTTAPAGVALLRAGLSYVAVAALLWAVFAPSQPARRLVDLSDRSAKRITRLLKWLAVIYAADLFLSAFGQILYFPLSLSVVQSLITSLAFAGVLIGLLLTPFEPAKPQDTSSGLVTKVRRTDPTWLKFPLWIAAAAIILACLLGYVALGRFLAQQIVMTGVVALVATLLFLAIRAFTREDPNQRTSTSLFLEEQMGFDPARRRQVSWVAESILSLGVLMVALPILLLQWGFAGADIRDWFKSLLFGFEVGTFKISLVRILIGIGIFMALLFATRLIQRRLRENVLIQPRMDAGIAHSVDTAVGYAGTALAAIVAISYAGFDITNLAIVAGALSVGIGFGLQSIVNNFVSGLILLIERPIKVGDWVVVGNEQGNVKRISVRSTEIETFDRASLIVPNSELITGRVLNWTHRNALGRVVLKFNAGPDADPRRVLEILRSCAEKHPDILREPAPLAVFEGYTPTTTDYSLRVLLPDINRGLRVQSDLRIAIFEALRKADLDPVASTSGNGATATAAQLS